MRYAIIDVGSNTIRTAIYDVNGENYKNILNERDYSSLISYIVDNSLTSDGYKYLLSVLTRMANLCRENNCDEIHCFATASLRNLKNSDSILCNIKNCIGVDINILSGEDEAFLDYAGLLFSVNTINGIGLDLGGGSCQVFSYENSEIIKSSSFPIGCLKMYNSFVKGNLPTDYEASTIRAYVFDTLSKNKYFFNLGFDKVYTMGGTAKTLLKLYPKLLKSDYIKNSNILSVATLDKLYNSLYSIENDGFSYLKKNIPKRATTIIPGIIVLKTVCEYIGADKLEIVSAGVREGYLYSKILKKI